MVSGIKIILWGICFFSMLLNKTYHWDEKNCGLILLIKHFLSTKHVLLLCIHFLCALQILMNTLKVHTTGDQPEPL